MKYYTGFEMHKKKDVSGGTEPWRARRVMDFLQIRPPGWLIPLDVVS